MQSGRILLNFKGRGGGRLKGIEICSVNSLKQGGWAFIEGGVFIRAFTVCEDTGIR